MIPCASISLAQTISQCLHCFAAATHIPVVALPTGSIRACLARGRSTAYIRIIKTPPPFVNGFWMGIIEKKKQKARGTRERRGRLPKNDDKASAAEKRRYVRRQRAREGELPAGQGKPARAAHVQSGRFRGFLSFKNGGQRGENTFSARLRAGPSACAGPARRRRGSKGIFFREGGESVGEVGGTVLDVVEVLVGVEAVVLHLDQGHGDVGTVVRDALTVVQQV